MTPHQDDAQMRGDRPGRLDVRRPYLFTFLIVIMIMVVTGASGAGAAVSGLPTSDFELGAEVVLAVLAAVGLTRLHSWRDVGFRPLARARDLRLYWVPLFPVLPVLAPAARGAAAPSTGVDPVPSPGGGSRRLATSADGSARPPPGRPERPPRPARSRWSATQTRPPLRRRRP